MLRCDVWLVKDVVMVSLRRVVVLTNVYMYIPKMINETSVDRVHIVSRFC